jgi:hypothetical protein
VNQHRVIGRVKSEIRHKLEQVIEGLSRFVLARETEKFIEAVSRCGGIQLDIWAAIEKKVMLASALHMPSPFEKSLYRQLSQILCK